jgi:hypothetical protein
MSQRLTNESTRSNKDKLIYQVGPNDVLLGRGAPIINNEGNIRFRKVVNSCKAAYIASCRHDRKNLIAKEVMDTIATMEGRFLRKIEDIEEATKLGISIMDDSAYLVVDEDIALQKVKVRFLVTLFLR